MFEIAIQMQGNGLAQVVVVGISDSAGRVEVDRTESMSPNAAAAVAIDLRRLYNWDSMGYPDDYDPDGWGQETTEIDGQEYQR